MLYWVVGLGAIVTALLFYKAQKSASAKIKTPEVPERYRSYRSLFDGIETDGYLSHKIMGPNEANYAVIKYYHPADTTLILLTNNYSGVIGPKEPWIDTYLKMNSKGTIIDTLSSPYTVYREILGHLLAPDHHSSWCLDGDTSKKAYSDVSLKPSSTKTEMLANFSNFYKDAEIVTYRKDFDRETKKWTHTAFLFKDSDWSLISQGDILDFEELYKQFPSKPHYKKLEMLQLGSTPIGWLKSTDALKLVHFQKAAYQKEKSNGAFNPNNATISAHWNGKAFLKLTIGQDTVPFTLPMRQEVKDSHELLLQNRGKLTLFKHPKLHFALLGLNEGEWYCIKPK